MTDLICICCPMGCRMTVQKQGEEFIVTGNTCPRGKKYAIEEMTAPVRTVTSSVRVRGGDCPMLSVKTDKPLSKSLIFDSLAALSSVCVDAPVAIGDVVLSNVVGSDVNFVATRCIAKK